MSDMFPEPPDRVLHVHHFIHPFGWVGGLFGRGSNNVPPAGSVQQSTADSSTIPPAPVNYGSGTRNRSGAPWEWLWWLLLAALVVLAVVWLALQIHRPHHGKATAVSVPKHHVVKQTMPRILASEHFETSDHAVCSWQFASNNTAYVLYLNSGGACHRQIRVVVPVAKVASIHGWHFKRLSVTFVYDGTRLTPTAAKALKKHSSLGEQATMHLRNIVARGKS